jgi:hypothetical protein
VQTKAAGGRPVVMRLAQMTAGLATVAFAAVLAADLTQSDENGTSQRQASGDAAAPMANGGESQQFVTVTVSALADSGSDDDSGELPALEDGPAGAGGVQPTPNATDSLYERNNARETPAIREDDTRDYDSGAQPPTEGPTSSVGIDTAGDDDEKPSGFVVAEVGLAALALGGVVAWFIARRARPA